MDENDARERPGKRTRRSTGSKQRSTASASDVTLTVLVPKYPDAKPDDKDAWVELGPNDPLPECVADNFIGAFTPLVRDFLDEFDLDVDDFDDQTWGPFIRAFVGHTFMQAEDTERLRQVVKEVLEKKIERLKQGAEKDGRRRRTETP